MNTDTHVLLLTFQNMVYYCWMIKWMKNVINSKEQKFSLRELVSICLFFCQFQPGIAYKGIAYKKSV